MQMYAMLCSGDTAIKVIRPVAVSQATSEQQIKLYILLSYSFYTVYFSSAATIVRKMFTGG